jgi:hypothetical protein
MAPDHSAWLQTGMQLQPHHVDLVRVAALRFEQDNAAKPEAVQPLVLTAEPAPQFTLQGLFDLCVQVSEPKVARRHVATLALCKEFRVKQEVWLSEKPSLSQSRIICVASLSFSSGLSKRASKTELLPR